MNCRHDDRLQEVRIRMHRQAHVKRAAEAGGERMRRDGGCSMHEVVAHAFQYLARQLKLLLRVKIICQARVIDGMAAFLDAAQQLCADLAYRLEQAVKLAGCHARLKQVKQGIIARLSITKAVGYLALNGDGACQPGSEAGEVVLLAGTYPGLETAGLHTRHLLNQRARQLRRVIVHAASFTYQSAVSVSILLALHNLSQFI